MSMTLLMETMKKYMSDVFVETGTFDGGGVKLALAAGFKRVISIELDPGRFAKAKEILKGLPVELHEGDSSDILPQILESLNEKATIFFDAHPIGAGDLCKFGRQKWPLAEELRMVAARSKRKDHNLLVDDRHDFGLFGLIDEQVFRLIKDINPKYEIMIEPNVWSSVDLTGAMVRG
jgi:hypothetical protein